MPTTISLNATGAEVQELQGGLAKLGLAIPAFERQGSVFGIGTRGAVGALQRRLGLQATGVVDEATQAAIKESLAALDSGLDRVEGRVLTPDGGVATGAALVLYRRAAGKDAEKIGEARVDEDGYYAIPWRDADAGEAEYELRMPGADGQEVLLATLSSAQGRYAAANLVAPEAKPQGGEFAALSAALTASLGGLERLAEMKEEGTRRDISLLHEQTGWDARLITLAAAGERLAGETGLPREAAYALLRAGLPSDVAELANAGGEAVRLALGKARESGIVALDDAAAGKAMEAYAGFARDRLAKARAPGQLAAPRDFLQAAPLDDAQRATVESLYLVDQLRGEALWKAAREKGLPEAGVAALRAQGKLAFMTQGNAPLAAAVQQELGGKDLSALVDLDLHSPAGWQQRIRAAAGNDAARLEAMVPPALEGQDLDTRLAAYSESLARTVRLSYPTETAARMIQTGELVLGPDHAAVGDAAATVLRRAAAGGFDLDREAIAPRLRAERDALFQGIPAEAARGAEESLKSLQRIRQITPGEASAKLLLEAGIGSAAELVALGKEGFIGRFVEKIPRPDLELIFHRAVQVRAVTFNIFNGVNELQAQPPLFAASPAPEGGHPFGEAKDALLKTYPTLESLFGSLDYGDCEECQSVLGPAAYLVDLLRMLDPPEAAWNQFLAAWKARHGGEDYLAKHQRPYDALMALRPDIAHLPLTCENTETALPYIDVVNEILEFAVARGALAPEAARDTGDAPSEDLIAEPQNVMREAYDVLAAARYPAKLPFDLWLETARAFFTQAGTPLWQALEVLRRTDELSPPAGIPYGREAIFAERLGIGPAEQAILTAADAADTWFTLYGYADAASARAGLASARELARRLEVSYAELVALASTWFVNPALERVALLRRLRLDATDVARLKGMAGFPPLEAGDKASIEARLDAYSAEHAVRGFDARAWLDAAWNDGAFKALLVLRGPAGSDFSATSLVTLEGNAPEDVVFARLALFVRLWRRLGWGIADTDNALRALIPAALCPADAASGIPTVTAATLGQAMRAAILSLSHARALTEMLPFAREGGPSAALQLWAEIGTEGVGSLYARLFLRPGTTGVDPAFDHPLGAYLTAAPAGAAQPFTWAPGDAESLADGKVALANHLGPVQAALRLSGAEIETVLAATRGIPAGAATALEAAPLDLATLSLLHRHALLARVLRMPVAQLVALAQLSGLDPFKPIAADFPAGIAEDHPFSSTIAFVELAQELKEAGLAAEELDWLLRHRFDPVGKLRPDPALPPALMRGLGAGIAALRAEHAAPSDPMTLTDDRIAAELALALPAPAAETFMAAWTGRLVLEVEEAGVEAADQLDPALLRDQPSLVPLYRAGSRAQRLTRTGFLPQAERDALKAAIPAPPLLHRLLDALAERQRALLLGAFGAFLQEAQFETLFAPPPAGADDAALAARETARRQLLAETLLPFLRARLSRAQVLEAMAAATGADRALLEAMLNDPALLAESPGVPLAEPLMAAAERGASAWFHDDPAMGGAVPEPVRLEAADTAAARPETARAARIAGWLEVPEAGSYRFTVRAGRKDADIAFRLGDAEDPVIRGKAGADGQEFASAPIELRPGIAYRFELLARAMGGGDVAVLVASDSLPRSSLDALTLYPEAALRRVERAAIRLGKALRLAALLGLEEPECRHVSAHPQDFAGFAFNSLPADAAEGAALDAPALLAGVRALLCYRGLRQEIAGGSPELVGLLALAERRLPGEMAEEDARAAALAALAERLGAMARRPATAVAEAATWLGEGAELVADAGEWRLRVPLYAEPARLARLWAVLRLASATRLPVPKLAAWARPDPDADAATGLRDATRAAFAPEAWRAAAKPIFDTLRQRRRDALVSHLMQREGYAQPEKLFEAYLIDPGMEPVVLTSRIQLAIASVQTFVQRCLLNLIPAVHPTALDAARWEWMRRYRVWDANRRIFLFPENWLEPEFRDDKSHLFQALEGSLLEGDVTDEAAENAFLAYLRGLEEIARLEMVSMWTETDPVNASRGRVHVLARTVASRKYFYRAASNGMWEPWIPVDIEIEGEQVCLATWRGRVHVFWLTFVAQGTQQDNGTMESAAKKTPAQLSQRRFDTRVNWCEWFEGRWIGPNGTTAEDGGTFIAGAGFEPTTTAIFASKEWDTEGRERAILINNSGSALRMTSPNAAPRLVRGTPRPVPPYELEALAGDRFRGSGALSVNFRSAVEASADPAATPGAGETLRTETATILGAGGSYRVVGGGNPYAPLVTDIGPLAAPFFYQDEDNTFFVEPEVTVTTVQIWQDWLPGHGTSPPHWKEPDWWKDLPLQVQVAQRPPRIPLDLGDPAPWYEPGGQLVTNPAERLAGAGMASTGPVRDWLTAPGTLVSFGDRVVGRQGGLDLVQLTAPAARPGAGGGLVAVQPGLAAGLGEAAERVQQPGRQLGGLVVETAPGALGTRLEAGAQLGGVGLVVGAGGITSNTIRDMRGTAGLEGVAGRIGALGRITR